MGGFGTSVLTRTKDGPQGLSQENHPRDAHVTPMLTMDVTPDLGHAQGWLQSWVWDPTNVLRLALHGWMTG